MLYDAAGVAMAVADGVGIPVATKALLFAGSDGANARFAKITSTRRLVVDGSEVTQPVSAASLPLPTGAATEATLATRAASSQLPGALVGGRLDQNLGAWLGATTPTVGQKTMTASIPVVIASNQTPISVSGVTAFVDTQQMFVASVQLNTPSSGTDNPLMLIRNPGGSGKNLYVWKFQAGTSINNVSVKFKMFVNPTITANGAALTIVQRDVGSGVASVMTAFQTPTISALGSPVSQVEQGQNANSVIFADDFTLKLRPGTDLLLTGDPSSNNRESLITAIWREAA